MLRWRLLLGSMLIAGIAVLAWLEHRWQPPGVWVTLPLLLAISVLASQEFITLARAGGHAVLGWVVYAGNLALAACSWIDRPIGFSNTAGGLGVVAITLAGALFAAFLEEMRRYRSPGKSIGRLAVTALGLVYVGVLLGFVAQLRLLGGGSLGIPAIASLLIVVKMSDTGAYTVGRLMGAKWFKRKLAPVLSPGKTIEGALGGLAFACAGSALVFLWIVPAMADSTHAAVALWRWIAFGLLVAIAGMVGDLAESLLKRDAGRKDSSDWLPGFGGVLDLMDSILLAAPVAYVCWRAGLV